jgi:hypothetical protein
LDAPRKWKVANGKEMRGRVANLPIHAVSRLADVAHAVGGMVAVSAEVMQTILQKEVSAMNLQYDLSLSWVKRFMIANDMAYLSSSGVKQKQKTAAEIEQAKRVLRLKVLWLRRHFDIPWARCWNLDETAVRLLPLGDRGWAKKGPRGKRTHFLGDSRTQITVTIACGAAGGLLHQVIVDGTTDRVVPVGPKFPGQEVVYTKNHWMSQDTLTNVVDQIDCVLNPNGEQRPWLCLLDCAPVHIAGEWRSFVSEQRPWIKLCYVSRGFMGSCQPLDVAYMKSFEAKIKR